MTSAAELEQIFRELIGRRSERSVGERVPQLVTLLAALGPLFVAFGRYLGSRPDLFEVDECYALLQLDERSPAVPWSVVEEILWRELGPLHSRFADLERSPRAARFGLQVHVGRTLDGESVQLRIASLPREWRRQARFLDRVVRWLAAGEAELAALRAAATDFVAEVEANGDLERQRVAHQLLAECGGRLTAPIPLAELSTAAVLTLARSPGATLAELQLGTSGGQQALAEGWLVALLARAVEGGWMVAGFAPSDVVREGSRWRVCGGTLFETSRAFGDDLGSYLGRVAIGEPDAAAEALVPLLQRLPRRHDALRETLRLTGASPPRGALAADPLARDLVEQWQRLRAVGAVPRPALLKVFRGLFVALESVHRLEAKGDLLTRAFQEVQAEALWQDLTEKLSVTRLGEVAQRWIAAAPVLPIALDSALDRLTGNRFQEAPRRQEEGSRWGSRGPALVALAALAGIAGPFAAALESRPLGWVIIVALAAALGHRLARPR